MQGLKLVIDKLTGAMPLRIDAPSKGLRKKMPGNWQLLAVIRNGFLALISPPIGALLIYFASHDSINLKMLGYRLVALAVGVWLVRRTMHAAGNLRSIARV